MFYWLINLKVIQLLLIKYLKISNLQFWKWKKMKKKNNPRSKNSRCRRWGVGWEPSSHRCIVAGILQGILQLQFSWRKGQYSLSVDFFFIPSESINSCSFIDQQFRRAHIHCLLYLVKKKKKMFLATFVLLFRYMLQKSMFWGSIDGASFSDQLYLPFL